MRRENDFIHEENIKLAKKLRDLKTLLHLQEIGLEEE